MGTNMSLLHHPFDPAREAALVTGAGNGIGRAIAQALVGEGVRTVFDDVNRDTVTSAIKASARPELAVPWVPDLAGSTHRAAPRAVATASVRRGQASDLAPLAQAVLSNRISAYVTGAAIVIDGGLSLTNWFEPPELGDL